MDYIHISFSVYLHSPIYTLCPESDRDRAYRDLVTANLEILYL